MTMSDFILFLPSEILTHIFSNVNQEDCMECMAVCRRWHKLIPQHATEVWKELEISKKSWSKFNNAMSQCLSHVKKVSFPNAQNPHKQLQRLERQGCNIQSLEITAVHEVYTFDLHRATLFDGIGLFGQTLKELFIYGPYAQYFSLTTFLDLLPALTHLTIKLMYSFDEIRFEYDEFFNETTERNIQSDNDSNNNNMYNLVFLSLDSHVPWNFRIKHIVKRCPRLTYLLDITTALYQDPSKRYIEFEDIRQLCPSIRYILWGDEYFHIRFELEKQWLTLSRRKRKYTDVENTDDYEESETKNLRQVSFCSGEEEQLISVLKVCLQQSSLSEHLRLSGSMCVDLYQLWNNFKQQNSNLLTQPPQLKSLEFDYLYVSHKLKNSMFFENLFNHFRHIERLHMGLHVMRVDNVDEEQNTVSKMVEAIGHQLHQLRCLHISLNSSDKLGSTRVLVNNLVTTLCKCNQKLEILHLSDVPISNDMLLDLCHHPKLHTLSLAGGALHEQLTKDGWISFARKLKEQEQIGYNGGKIRSLVLSCLCSNDVTDEVLEEFAGIKRLETLRIEYNNNITVAGINKFASIKSSISKNYKKIEVYECGYIFYDNPDVIFSEYPFHPYFF